MRHLVIVLLESQDPQRTAKRGLRRPTVALPFVQLRQLHRGAPGGLVIRTREHGLERTARSGGIALKCGHPALEKVGKAMRIGDG